MSLILRTAGERDLDDMARIMEQWRESGHPHLRARVPGVPDSVDSQVDYHRDILTLMEKNETDAAFVVALKDQQLVGFGLIRDLFDRAAPPKGDLDLTLLRDLYVSPEHLRSGIGRSIHDELVDQARQRGKIYIDVHFGLLTEPAIAFLRALGYQHTGDLQGHPMFRLTLGPPSLPH